MFWNSSHISYFIIYVFFAYKSANIARNIVKGV